MPWSIQMPATAAERLAIQRVSNRVLSIQSHVVSGYAGNRCSVFPLQLHGFEVDNINSVQFSNHTGYKHIRGQRLTAAELSELYEGLKLNNLNRYSHVITGYVGDVSFLEVVGRVVQDLKKVNPEIVFVCDPVLGDNGHYYTPTELMPVYRDQLLSLTDVLTPNAFELSQLSGLPVSDESTCLTAISHLQTNNPNLKLVVVTSGVPCTQKNVMYCYASKRTGPESFERYRFTIPLLRGNFVGTGDVFVALLVVWLIDLDGNVPQAVSNVIASLQAILRRTSERAFSTTENPDAGLRELRLIDSRIDLLEPKDVIEWTSL